MILKGKLIKNLLPFFISLFLISCNAPRDNPLDPYGRQEDLVQIEGMVQSQTVPFTPLSNVWVFWVPGNVLVQTDTSGKFLVKNIKPINGPLIFQKDGYLGDTLTITWDNNKKVTAPVVSLNKIPKLESISIYSEVVNQSVQNQNSKLADLVFKVKVNDTDNDIDSVFIKNQALNFTGGLELQSKIYQASFTTTALNVSDIEQTIGSKFDVWVIDKLHNYYLVGGGKAARVIKSGTEVISPLNDTVAVPVILNWNQFNAGYPFTYKIEVYNSASLELVFSKDNVQPGVQSLEIDTSSVSSGDYFWAVSVVDQFFDSYKSQPGKFHIK